MPTHKTYHRLANFFLSKFDIQYPILQAPMAGVSTPELAATVSNAGGLGAIAIGASTLEQASALIDQTSALTSRPFNVNVFCHTPAKRHPEQEAAWIEYFAPLFNEFSASPPPLLNEIYKSFLVDEPMFRLLLEKRPACVSFHFGIPRFDWVKAFREKGIRTMATATNIEDASEIEKMGIDAIIAQGSEAGGHRGIFEPDAPDELLPTSKLVSLLVDNSALPIIAAGGIMDGAGIKAMLKLGAAAAQLGTAFILCPESSASAAYRANLKSEMAAHTQFTSAISGRPARGLINRFIAYAQAANDRTPAAYPVAYDLAKQLASIANAKGNHDFDTHWAGQGASQARELPAADLMAALIHEMHV